MIKANRLNNRDFSRIKSFKEINKSPKGQVRRRNVENSQRRLIELRKNISSFRTLEATISPKKPQKEIEKLQRQILDGTPSTDKSPEEIEKLQRQILDGNQSTEKPFKFLDDPKINSPKEYSFEKQIDLSLIRSNGFSTVYSHLKGDLQRELQNTQAESQEYHTLKVELLKVGALEGFWNRQAKEDGQVNKALQGRETPLSEQEAEYFNNLLNLRQQLQIETDTRIQLGTESSAAAQNLQEELEKINISQLALINGAKIESIEAIFNGESIINSLVETKGDKELLAHLHASQELDSRNELELLSFEGKTDSPEYLDTQVKIRQLYNTRVFIEEQKAQDIHLQNASAKNPEILRPDSEAAILFQSYQDAKTPINELTQLMSSDFPELIDLANKKIADSNKLFILQNALAAGIKPSTVKKAEKSPELFAKLPKPDISKLININHISASYFDFSNINRPVDPEKPGIHLSNVGNFAQRHKSCGAAAMANVLFYYGINVDTNQNGLTDENNVFKDFDDNEAKPIRALVEEAHRRGFATGVKENAKYEDIEHYIKNGIPPILLIDSEFSRGISDHYVTVSGIDMENQTITYNSDGKEITKSIAEFDKGWRTNGKFSLHKRRTILGIAPPENAHNLLASKISKFSQLKDDAVYAYALFQDKEYLESLKLAAKTAGSLVQLGAKEVGYSIDREFRRNKVKAKEEARRAEKKAREEAKRVAAEARRAANRISNEAKRFVGKIKKFF